MREQTFIAVGGPSGTGKTELINVLVQRYPALYQRPVSFTTRAARAGESNAEYEFVSRKEMARLAENDLLANTDDVYGNLYGISRKSIDDLAAHTVWPIKEIHPSRFENLRASYPDLITVIILPAKDHRMTVLDRSERAELDNEYYKELDLSQFDIVRRSFKEETVNELADSVHRHLYALASFDTNFPRPPIIDTLNRTGYSLIAAEFTENLRPTTANFHELSRSFLRKLLSSPRTLGDRYLEVGPGQGWLRSEFNLKNVNYHAVEIADGMRERFKDTNGARVQNGSARHLDFTSNYFDAVIASLGDPFCYPTALCEIQRVLKPGGQFILTAPAKGWTEAVRPEHEQQKTSFRLSDGSLAQVYSFTFDIDELESLLEVCGLKVQEKEVARLLDLPRNAVVSPVLIEASSKLGKDNIPVLNMICAFKERQQ